MRVVTNLELLEEADIVTKTAYVIFFFFLEVISDGMIREFARVFGVDFFSVISRGSQFKVESFLFRIAKPESFVLISPSRHDVNSYPLTTHANNLFWSLTRLANKTQPNACPLLWNRRPRFTLVPSLFSIFNHSIPLS